MSSELDHDSNRGMPQQFISGRDIQFVHVEVTYKRTDTQSCEQSFGQLFMVSYPLKQSDDDSHHGGGDDNISNVVNRLGLLYNIVPKKK
jgi:hypothetical protein